MQQKKAQLIQRYNTAAVWQQYNPILLLGEIGIESDTGKAKFGDGVTAWNSLGYFINMQPSQPYAAGAGAIIDAHGALSTQLQYIDVEEV